MSGGTLATSTTVEVCVVGAGIAGLTSAYLAALEGKSVLVLEAREPGGGETARTSAHLSSVLDRRYHAIENVHGAEGAALAAASHTAAINRIEAIVAEERIACHFERLDGYLFAAPDGSLDELKEEEEAARRAGLSVDLIARAPLASFDTGPCLRFAGQAHFSPLAYLRGLARGIMDHGGRIVGNAPVASVAGGPEPLVTLADGGLVRARSVIVATNTPINDWVSIHLLQAAYRTYVVGGFVPPDSVARALFWDTDDPFHYVNVVPAAALEGLIEKPPGDLLLIGGEDHRTGQNEHTEESHERLIEWARLRFPRFGPAVVRWSGQVLESIDGLGLIGADPEHQENIYVATGDSGNGLTHGTIAGMLLTDLIAGRTNDWSHLYSPRRKPLRALGKFIRENAGMAVQYTDWLKGSEVDSVADIPPGSGAVVRRGFKDWVAIHRRADGSLSERSAVCPHLGCIVHWNPTESTWDCPCHGSRFEAEGDLLNGPAMTGLGDPFSNTDRPDPDDSTKT